MKPVRPLRGSDSRRIRILAVAGAATLMLVGTGALTGFHSPPHPVMQSDPTATGSELTTTEIIGIRTFTPPPGIVVTSDVVYDILADGTVLTLDVCAPQSPADSITADATVAGATGAGSTGADATGAGSTDAGATFDDATDAVATSDNASPAAARQRPAVISVHGGSWARGDKASSDWRGVCLWLASAGFVAYSVNYRLTPDAPFPAAIEDVARAVEWVREPANAAAYGIDPDRIGAFGGSAGGNLAALLGARGSGSWTAGSRVASVAVLSAPFDLREAAIATGEATLRDTWTTATTTMLDPATAAHPPGPASEPTGDLRRIALRYLGCSTLAECDAASAASATSAIDADDPPVFIGTAAAEFVPLSQAADYASKLARAGIPHTLVEVPGVAHSIGLLDEPMRASVSEFLHRTLGW